MDADFESHTTHRFNALTSKDGLFPEKEDRVLALMMILVENLEQIRKSVSQIEISFSNRGTIP
jgi:hypothetical protein